MIRPRWNKVLSDLWSNKSRSFLVVASIMIGLFAVGIIATIWVVISTSMASGYAAVSPANITISTQAFDQKLVDVIRHSEGVADAEGVYVAGLRARTGPYEWSSINLQAFANFQKMTINRVKRIEGSWPPGRDEVVIDKYRFADLNAHIGDWIEIEMPSGDKHSLKIVGIIMDQTIGANGIGGGFFLAPVQGYISDETLPHLELLDVYNTLYVTVAGNPYDRAHIAEVSDRVRKVVENSGRRIGNLVERRSNEHPNSTYVDAISGVLLLLGLFVVFLSGFLVTNTISALLAQQVQQIAPTVFITPICGFLVTNTISALLAQQVQQIGVMKTVGARRTQIITVYMSVLFIYGMLACVISIPLSDFAATRIMQFLASKINFTLLDTHFVSLSVTLQVIIALVVPQLAGFIPILGASRISVQEALSGVTQSSHAVKRSWLDRRVARVKGISRPILISLRNTFRRKGRLALTLLTLSLGGGVFIATFNVRASLEQHVQQVSHYFLADVNLTLDRAYRIDRIQAELSAIPDVKAAEGWAQSRATMVNADGTIGESINILAPQANSQLIDPVLISGRWLRSTDRKAIALSERFLSQYPNIHVGDTLKLKINGKDTDWQVVGFFQLAGKSGGLLSYANYTDLSETIGQPNKAVTFRIVSKQPGLTEEQQKALARKVETHMRDRGYRISDISAGDYLFSSAARGLNVLTVFLLIMASLIALVGSIGLAGTMSMNVMERTREIGVMRSIGASDRILNIMVLLEGTLIGTISWVFGTLVSLPMSKLMSDTINVAIFDSPSKFTFTPQGLVIWLIVVIVLSVLASLMPARNATRLTIREVLAYE
jgi:putative ABC transport system permease protein